MSHSKQIAQLMCQAIYMLGNAVDDVEAGRYGSGERAHLADALDLLSSALRSEEPVTVDGGVHS